MATVVISPFMVADYLQGGGHFWVYVQYVEGLRQLGCDVYWLEEFRGSGSNDQDARVLAMFFDRMEQFSLGGKVIPYRRQGGVNGSGVRHEFIGATWSEAEALFRRADLLLNFHYRISPELLSCFRRTALVDIDPGLLQCWVSAGDLALAEHDCYFTIGETVGTPAARFPDCGLTWLHTPPPVCLQRWPYAHDPSCRAFTTVSAWWAGQWMKDGDEVYDNNKRISFLEFMELPGRTSQALELALYLGEKDAGERRLLETYGWRVRHSLEVARTPERYQRYVQTSRGEFSCAKPSYRRLRTAWISDRTLCYLASGKPVVVQDTGPSSFLPNGKGMFRFATMEQAVEAFGRINADYAGHCQAAREIAEAFFDAERVMNRLLNAAFGGHADAGTPGKSRTGGLRV